MARLKFTLAVATLSAAALVAAQPHDHGHAHVHRKGVLARDLVEEHIAVTVIECWLGDHAISEADCSAGIANGTLKWASDGSLSAASYSSAYSSATTLQASTSSSTSVAAQVTQPQPQPQNIAGSSAEFPDGQIDCSHFPSDYGAVALEWLGLGGWASAQQPGAVSPAGFSDILTVTSDQCQNGNGCINGAYCSYACPDGQLKYQWPTMQGATGQSVGGLLCQGGKLYKTNPSVKTLCGPGASQIKVHVQNKLSSNVAVCQTNYPGDEKMSLPTDAQPGMTLPLACPDGPTYYQWEGKQTSAQYYINMPGVSVPDACVWGAPGSTIGNWAPMNAGVGWSNGFAWVSIFPNLPTQPDARIPFTVEILGDNISGACRYQDGNYCTGANFGTCSPSGCTVSASSGNVYFVFS